MVKAKAKEKPIPPKIHCAYDELVSIEKLVPHPKNRNQHSEEQIERLASILEYQGIRKPCVVSKRSGFMTTWHGRLLAAKYAKWTHVPVNYQDYDSEEQEYADLVADNAIAEWATLDLASINKDLPALGPELDIEMLGIKDFVLEPMDKFKGDEDAVPEVPKEPTTRMGDLYLLGNHRLLCGDSTDKVQVERLMNGEKADMVFTDPPYGVGYDPGWREKFCEKRGNEHDRKTKTSTKYMTNDDDFDFTAVIASFDPTVVYVWHASSHTVAVHNGLSKNGITPKQMIVWNKTMHVLSRSHYHWKHEPCWYAVKEGQNHMWAGATDQTTVWDFPPMHSFANKEEHTGHACQKPVALMEKGIANHTCKIVADPFLGSGSTLIACEKTNRRCFGLEIDPLYCDVIVERWEKYTGKKATKVN